MIRTTKAVILWPLKLDITYKERKKPTPKKDNDFFKVSKVINFIFNIIEENILIAQHGVGTEP